MGEHPTPWSLKMEGGEYVIRDQATGDVISRHKKKAEAVAAFANSPIANAVRDPDPPGEVVEIPPADAPVADPPPPEVTPPDKPRRKGRRK